MKLSKNQLIIIALAITLHLFTSCEKSLIGIKGDGPVVTEEINLSEIEGITLAATGNVHVTHSENQSIQIKSHQNIIDNMEWNVHNKHLTIEFDRNVRDYESLDIYISLNELTKLKLSGSGNVTTSTVFNTKNSFKASISGSGDMDINVNAPEIDIDITGSGDLKLYTETEYLDGNITGSGDFDLSGSSNITDYSIRGSGDISAYGLTTKKSDIYISGSGDIELRVTEKLDVTISGAGDVYYKGYPTITSNISGSGKVRSAN